MDIYFYFAFFKNSSNSSHTDTVLGRACVELHIVNDGFITRQSSSYDLGSEHKNSALQLRGDLMISNSPFLFSFFKDRNSY